MGPKALTAQAFLPVPHSLSGRTRLSFQSWPTICLSRFDGHQTEKSLILQAPNSGTGQHSEQCLLQRLTYLSPIHTTAFTEGAHKSRWLPHASRHPNPAGGAPVQTATGCVSSLTLASITLSEHTGCSHSTRCCFCLENASPSLPSWHWAAGS